MNKSIAQLLLQEEMNRWDKASYDEALAHLDKPFTRDITGSDGKTYQVEINVFWDDTPGKNLRIIISIDDGGWWRSIFPMSTGILKTKESKLMA